ncbi:MAG: exodeoxyribonuclease VII large subunit, partial [Boseongicola sp.]|nr:exodeoxyribonuclease VII large subunit [Boseongicola sp.]
LEQVSTRMAKATKARLARLAGRLQALDRTRSSLGYKATLARGYAIIRSGKSVLTRAEEARRARSLEIEFQDGRIRVAGTTGASRKPGPSRARTDRNKQS